MVKLSVSCLFAGLTLSAMATAAEELRQGFGPALVQPAKGAALGRKVTVAIGFPDKGPRAPAEGTGLGSDRPPLSLPPPLPPPLAEPIPRGPSEGTGLPPAGERRPPRGPHFALLIDAPPPEPGAAFQTDAQHVAFPSGLPQMTVVLPPGPHKLLLVTLDREGHVSPRFHPAEPVDVTVR